MATAASSYYSEDDRPLNQGAQVDRTGSYAGNTGKTGRHSLGVQSAGSSVVYEPSNENEEHRIRRGLMPTSEGAPQVHPVRNTSHIPEGETHTGLVGTDGRPLTHDSLNQHGDLGAHDHHNHASSNAGLGNSDNNNNATTQGEQYTARDEGLEPYSAPPQTEGQATSGNHPTSGYLPEKKIGPAAGATTSTGGEQQHSSTGGLTGATSGHDNNTFTNDNSGDNKRSILADPSHPDNVLVEELERRAQKSGTHAVGFGTHGDEEPPLAHGGYDNDASHLRNNKEAGLDNHLAAGAYSRGGGNTTDNEGDHTDNEAPDMQPSQSYIQRQSLYSQPPSTRAGDHGNAGEPLTQEKLGQQSYGHQDGPPFSSHDYGHGHGGHLVPAGGGVIRPVAGVLPQDAESGALARNYEPSSYTQAGMAGVGAGTAGGLGAAALAGSGARSSGASAVGTGHPDTAQYIQQPQYGDEQQQHNRDLAPQAQQMQNYPSQQTQRTQQTQQTNQSYGTAQGLQHEPEQLNHRQSQQQLRQNQNNENYNNNNNEHQLQQKRSFIPAPMPIFQDHHNNQESQLHEDLPGQQEQQLHIVPGQGQEHLQQQEQQQPQMNGPTTGVAAVPAHTGGAQSMRNSVSYPQSTATSPISGGGLGAAIATSGHDLTKGDKKSLKQEIKSERKFEKSLTEQAKKEAQEIEIAMKMAKLSLKKADKSGRYEANYRSTYEKAIKKEVAAKQRLLRVTNEYNKVAADLERVNKEMEIRRNLHIADLQTRDADADKVAELRRIKGQHDMEREARHGDSLIKQKQAKRALSMSSKRKSSLF